MARQVRDALTRAGVEIRRSRHDRRAHPGAGPSGSAPGCPPRPRAARWLDPGQPDRGAGRVRVGRRCSPSATRSRARKLR
ncbi:hypothetical protein HBB16_19185 [Pseudonocardia sp. MCCB 268]|nr:hypothetical protein [Pseudonocardia cytotoxica]